MEHTKTTCRSRGTPEEITTKAKSSWLTLSSTVICSFHLCATKVSDLVLEVVWMLTALIIPETGCIGVFKCILYRQDGEEGRSSWSSEGAGGISCASYQLLTEPCSCARVAGRQAL